MARTNLPEEGMKAAVEGPQGEHELASAGVAVEGNEVWMVMSETDLTGLSDGLGVRWTRRRGNPG